MVTVGSCIEGRVADIAQVKGSDIDANTNTNGIVICPQSDVCYHLKWSSDDQIEAKNCNGYGELFTRKGDSKSDDTAREKIKDNIICDDSTDNAYTYECEDNIVRKTPCPNGCADNYKGCKQDPDLTDKCTPNDTPICEGKMIKICKDQKWESTGKRSTCQDANDFSIMYECQDSGEAPTQTTCQLGCDENGEKCVDGNLTTERCETGKACNGGICNIPGETCTASSDCPSNEETVYVCVRGQCLIQPNCYPGITAPRCENASTLKKCDENGVLRTTTCQYYETCESTIKSGDTCVSREGKACNEDSFTNQCFLAEDNNQYLEKCINNKIAFKNCTTAGSSSSMYCASIHGITECMFSCPSTHVESANCTADSYGAYFSMCTKGEDVAGNAGFFSVPYKGYCEKTLAQYCYKDALKNITMMALDCNSLNPATTCDASLNPSKGFCQELASCSTPTASCDGKTAINCIPNPVGEGNVLIKSDCASECDVYSPSSDSSWKMAKCYLEKAGKGSTFGLCLGDGTIGVLEGDHSLILTCMANTVKLTSENGHEYCICAE